MLESFRQHRQLGLMMLLPALLLVWLSFSCQNCFADTAEQSMQAMHAAMDCCPDGHDGHDHSDQPGCDTNYLVKQPMLSDQAAPQLVDFTDVLMPLPVSRFAAVHPQLAQPPVPDTDPPTFSDRLFSSYRILLI